MARFPLVVVALAALGCAESVPDKPTWADDVQPILRANCIRCHGDPIYAGALPGLRFDLYDGVTLDGDEWDGAAVNFARIAYRAGQLPIEDAPAHAPDMPPDPFRKLDPQQQEILRRWAGNLTDGLPSKGTRPGNHPPTVALVRGLPAAADQSVTIDFLASDADLDGVVGAIKYGPADTDAAGWIHHFGRGEIVWKTAAVPAGTYTLTASVHDDFDSADVPLGTVEIAHP